MIRVQKAQAMEQASQLPSYNCVKTVSRISQSQKSEIRMLVLAALLAPRWKISFL